MGLLGQSQATVTDGVKTPEILEAYHSIQTALAKDDFATARNEAIQLTSKLDKWKEKGVDASAVKQIRMGAQAIADEANKDKIRRQFGVLSEGTVKLLQKSENWRNNWKLYHCPMAKGYKKWVQPTNEDKMMNPYMGASMQQCGSSKPWG